MAPQPGENASWPRRVEVALAMLCIATLTNALIGPVFAPDQSVEAPILRLVWLPVYAIAAVFSVWRAPRIARFWIAALLGLGLVVLCFISEGWSIDPLTTNRRAIALGFTTLFGLYLAASFDGRELAEMIGAVFVLLGIGALAMVIVVPSIGIHSDINAGAWRGLWYEKNGMGEMLALGALASGAAALLNPRRRGWWICAIVLMLFLIVMSRSKTSLLSTLAGLGGMTTLAIVRDKRALAVVAGWGVTTVSLAFGCLMWLDSAAFYEAIGKDPTLTGRTDIWAGVLRAVAERPMLGYGYAAFWGRDSAPADWIRKQVQWPVPSAHSGWLDVLVQLGWVGVAAFSVVLAVAAICAIARLGRVRDGYLSIMFLVIFAFMVMSESLIMVHNSLHWVLFMVALARVTGPAARAAPAAIAYRFAPREPIYEPPARPA